VCPRTSLRASELKQPITPLIGGQAFTIELLKKGFFLRSEAHTLTRKRGPNARAPAAYLYDFGISKAICFVHPQPPSPMLHPIMKSRQTTGRGRRKERMHEHEPP
jgi:hypothetical protein